ncbi:MAG: NTPase [Candidatus Bathyarchaeia archaeon]
MKKRILLLTGNPGVGKTTVLLRVVKVLKSEGYCVGGMISREVRSCGARIGFEILDLGSGKRGWLAHVQQRHGPQVGKYRVNLEDLKNMGANAIDNASEKSDIIIVDEIGPMELYSENFKEAMKKAVESGKLIIGTVHWRAKDKLIDAIKSREDCEIYTVTYENRANLHETLIKKASELLMELQKNKSYS